MNALAESKYVHPSLISISLTGVFTTIHHVYRLGLEPLIPFLIMLILPFVFLTWFRRSGNKLALWFYTWLVGMIVLWFGFIDGFLDHVIKALGLENFTILPGSEAELVQTVYQLWSPEAGHIFYEWTGIATFFLSIFAVYYTYRFVMEQGLLPRHHYA